MFKFQGLGGPFRILAAFAFLLPQAGAAQDRDTQEIERYALTDAAFAKYKLASTRLAAVPGSGGSCDEDDDDNPSIAAGVAKLEAIPGAKAAVQSAGMSTREFVVFSWSIVHNSLAAWVVSQPGGKLPAGTSQANVDFIKKHDAELKSLPKGEEADCDEEPAEEDFGE
jgi:hypothetical protein